MNEEKHIKGEQENMDRFDDEIDLFDLVDDIKDNFKWVVIGLVSTVLLTVAYLAVVTPVFKTEAVIKPASSQFLVQLLSPQLKGIYDTDESKIFNLAKSSLSSNDYRKVFYSSHLEQLKQAKGFYNKALSEEQNYINFAQRFGFKASGNKDLEAYYSVSFTAADPKLAAQLLNEYVEMSLQRRLIDIERTVAGAFTTNIKTLEDQAKTLRTQYLAQKSRRILELKEAHSIAEAVGQAKPVYHSLDIVGGQQPPLYLLGTKAIAAEIKALQNRAETAKNLEHGEDFFIEELPEVLAQAEALKLVRIDFSKVKIATIDSSAVVPVKPLKPRKLLIVALGLVAGMFVGLFMALIRAAFGRHKERLLERKQKK